MNLIFRFEESWFAEHLWLVENLCISRKSWFMSGGKWSIWSGMRMRSALSIYTRWPKFKNFSFSTFFMSPLILSNMFSARKFPYIAPVFSTNWSKLQISEMIKANCFLPSFWDSSLKKVECLISWVLMVFFGSNWIDQNSVFRLWYLSMS